MEFKQAQFDHTR
jgi:hypothetical protein